MSFLKKHTWLNIVYGVLLIVVGALTLTFAIVNIDVVDQVISISLAISLFIAGILNIASSLIAHTDEYFTTSLLVGSIAIAFGVVLLVNRTLIGSFIVFLLGTLLLALGAVYLIKAIIFIIAKQKVPGIVALFVIAAIAIALGIMVLCFKDESKLVIYSFVGASIVLMGVVELVLVVREIIAEKKKAKEEAEPQEFQDVEIINKEEKEPEPVQEENNGPRIEEQKPDQTKVQKNNLIFNKAKKATH